MIDVDLVTWRYISRVVCSQQMRVMQEGADALNEDHKRLTFQHNKLLHDAEQGESASRARSVHVIGCCSFVAVWQQVCEVAQSCSLGDR